ncbi:YbcC family protein [Prosthecobacter sp.]
MNTTLEAATEVLAIHKPVVLADKPNWLRHARNACLRVPPLWPLHSFVAVNPFVGLTGRPFGEVCGLMQRVTHESMLMSVDYFRKQFASRRITTPDLAAAIQQSGAEITTACLLAWLKNPEPQPLAGLQSLADIATTRFGGRWSTLITEEISKWCAAYFDEGQSAWRMPWKKQALFPAWQQAALIDATPEMLGFKGFRKLVAGLPESSTDAVCLMLDLLGVPAAKVEDYLHRLLMTLPGWSSYVQYQVRDKAMHGKHDESLLDLLAVRLAFETQLARQFDGADLKEEWVQSFDFEKASSQEKQLLWHAALELGFQRELCTKITQSAAQAPSVPRVRPAVQAVFCIDVRSEVMRRSLEAASPEIETMGFAGFFGMPIEYIPFGQRHGSSQVPVLFTPKYRIREHLPQATPEQEKDERRKLQVGRRVAHSWNAFKTSAVSCFSFVEAAGVGFAWKLVKDGFQLGQQDSHSCSSCTAPNLHEHKRLIPDPLDDTQAEAGIPPEDQVQLALGALKNMGLTSNFSRLVMLCGHGSNTTNNPYAAGLDCGACGGHAGDSNARVAAAILNQPMVRSVLEGEGIRIPQDTRFIAALHDTTTDAITLFDADKVPLSHETDLLQLQLWLEEGSKRCRQQRAASLGLASSAESELDQLIHQRSRDWAQVRPEWGLAGNAAFIAAPRERTQHLNLGGRVFLHNYRHSADTTKSTLELIMTAPMVVANWINLQYYASTVNNRLWGSGNKVTHNVVGTFGIQQGNGGDLQAGLPLQSVHNGETWMHEPVRLSVLIEAPRSDIDAVIAKHESVRQLVENGWLHLFAIEDEGRVIVRRGIKASWASV